MNGHNAFVTELNKKIDQYLETGEYEKIEEASRELCQLQGLDIVDKMPDDFLFQIKKKEKSNMDIMKRKRNKKENDTEAKCAHTFSISKAGLAACVFCAVVLVSVPVVAGVNSAWTKRMEQMNKKEQQKLLDVNDNRNMTNEHDTEALTFSREFSEEEKRRFDELWVKYEEEGLFPEGELQIVDKLEGDEEISSPVHETWNREIFLPASELTDEEMLQIIDFQHKSAYVVDNSDEAKKYRAAQKEFDENPNPGENDLSKEEAVAKASAYLEAMYDVDADAMDKSAEFGMGHSTMDNDQYGEWDVEFKGSDGWSYVVVVARQTGRVAMIDLHKGDAFEVSFGDPAPINEKIYTPVYEKAKGILNSMYPDIEITNGTVGYVKGEDGYTDNRFLQINLFTKDAYLYAFQYLLDDEDFSYLMVSEDSYDAVVNDCPESFNLITIE